jgi:3',5'-cyclic AMP phosphodiesterase CpdA
MNFHRYSEPITDRMPLYIARGNHEENDSVSESVFAKETGAPGNIFYKSEREDSLFFIILDTDIRGAENGILGIQLQWLGAILDSASSDQTVSHVFLFMHKPLFPQGPHRVTPLTNADDLHDLFLQNPKIRAVFSGHDHLFNRYEKDGLVYITTGGGGGDLYHGYGGDYHHFVKVSFYTGSNRINIKTIGIFNEVVDDFDL